MCLVNRAICYLTLIWLGVANGCLETLSILLMMNSGEQIVKDGVCR
jgi:hypothetical protein